MSLSLRNRLFVALAPDGMAISLRKKGWRSPVEELGTLSVTPNDSAPAWDAVLRALGLWLAQSKWKSSDAEIVLSDAFARYVLLPWSDGFSNKSEMTSLARIHFEMLFGAAGGAEKISWHLPGYGKDGIACSLREEFLQLLKETFAKHGVRVVSIEPRFVRTFNTWRKRVAGNGLLVSVENGLCVMAVLRDDLWRSIRTIKLPSNTPSALHAVIDRELVLQGESEQTRVYMDMHGVVDSTHFSAMERFHLLGRGLGIRHKSKVEIVEAAL